MSKNLAVRQIKKYVVKNGHWTLYSKCVQAKLKEEAVSRRFDDLGVGNWPDDLPEEKRSPDIFPFNPEVFNNPGNLPDKELQRYCEDQTSEEDE